MSDPASVVKRYFEVVGDLDSPVDALLAVLHPAVCITDGDFTRTIGLAVQGGWDTDCNGATAGSAFGAMHGAAALPQHWTAPLGDRISALAERTLAVAER